MALFFLGLAFAAMIGALSLHPEHAGSRSEYALWGIAAVCFAVSASFAVRNCLARGKAARRRQRIAVFAMQGQLIIQMCHDAASAHSPPPEDKANEWQGAVCEYLVDHLSPEYMVRFLSHHGLPTGLTVLSPPYSSVEGTLKARCARLNEFLKELGVPD